MQFYATPSQIKVYKNNKNVKENFCTKVVTVTALDLVRFARKVLLYREIIIWDKNTAVWDLLCSTRSDFCRVKLVGKLTIKALT